MSSNRGITLTSLLVYVIGLMIVITIVATFTGYFSKNVNEVTIENIAGEQHTRFVAYMTKDINSEEITYVKTANSNKNYVIIYFEDGEEHQYVYNDGKIYIIILQDDEVTKKITLCSNVTSNSEDIFNYSENKISYNFQIDSKEFYGSFNVDLD